MATKRDLLQMLKSVSLFEGLTNKELESVLRLGKEVTHEGGDTIVEQGKRGVGFHLITDGNARVLVRGRTAAHLKPGDYFGEMSLLDGQPRSATVKAETEVRTLSLASWDFLPLIDRHPSIARKMLLEMSRRLRDAEDSITH
jgi:CRP/FNR family cyclic AMP-dependent transcriptional regulator